MLKTGTRLREIQLCVQCYERMTLCKFRITFEFMDIFLFRDLERLNQTGNFSQAAELSNLSQPAFSRRIKTLETWVGAQLVDRSRQPVKLTSAGSQILEAGLQALARIEQERRHIRESLSLPDKYVVTFGTQHSLGWRFFPTWLHAFEDAYGPILSRMRADDLPSCLRDLRDGLVDFVIAYARPEDRSELDAVSIGRDRLIAVCKPEPNGAPLFDFENPSVAMPLLRFGNAAPIGRHLDHVLNDLDGAPRLQTVYENSMGGALRIRARAGDGVAWLPESLVAADLSAGVLVRTGKPEWSVDLDIRLMRDTRHANQFTQDIWSFLEVRQSVSLVS